MFKVLVGVPAFLTLEWGGEKVKGGQNGSQANKSSIDIDWEWKEEEGNYYYLEESVCFPLWKIIYSISTLKMYDAVKALDVVIFHS